MSLRGITKYYYNASSLHNLITFYEIKALRNNYENFEEQTKLKKAKAAKIN